MAGTLKFYGGNDTHPNPMRTAWDVFMNNVSIGNAKKNDTKK